LPPALRKWVPKDKSPLPSPGDEYLEYETAIGWGYTLGAWQCESAVNRARAMAHHLHKGMREGYSFEHAQKKGQDSGRGRGQMDPETEKKQRKLEEMTAVVRQQRKAAKPKQ